jgi:hypothetical protein
LKREQQHESSIQYDDEMNREDATGASESKSACMAFLTLAISIPGLVGM